MVMIGIYFSGLESLDGECCVARGLGSDDHRVDSGVVEDILKFSQTSIRS
jgi:hypothetical protein